MARRSWVPVVGGVVLVGGLLATVATGVVVLALMGPPMPYEAMRIVDAYGIRPTLAREIVNVAREIGAHPYHLADLINFESGGKFTSSARNPSSGAIGPIQITKLTAKRLGTTVDALANMSEETYMSWAQLYFERVSSGSWPDDPRPMPLDTPQRLYMSVFYPKARDWPMSKAFPSKVQEWNPGIVTVSDYIAGVQRIGKLSHLVGKEAA